VPTPHLDGRHVVFGEVVKGFEIVQAIEEARTDGRDKPLINVFIDSCGEVKAE
jgi:cyclophilin family peptidyl-prolyl cis-trans isomerase